MKNQITQDDTNEGDQQSGNKEPAETENAPVIPRFYLLPVGFRVKKKEEAFVINRFNRFEEAHVAEFGCKNK